MHAHSTLSDHEASFICEDEGATQNPDDLHDFQCTFCAVPAVPFDPKQSQKALGHIGAHILHDSTVNRAQEPCGLCLCPAPLCQFFLKKSSSSIDGVAVDFEKSDCINKMKFQYHPTSVSSEASPCSNVPIRCPICCQVNLHAPAVWKYNLQAHLKERHPSVDVEQYHKLWAITQSECAKLKKVYRDRRAVPKLREGKKKKQAATKKLKISESRSICRALQ